MGRDTVFLYIISGAALCFGLVNGKHYQSQNRIQVSMASQIGTTVTVRYDTQNPEKLYSFSVLRIVVSLVVAAICIVAALFTC